MVHFWRGMFAIGIPALLLTANPVLGNDYSGKLTEAEKQKYEDPGYFDVGAGFALIPKATQSGKDASGVMASFKAYPFGRWYAAEKAPADQLKASKDALKAAKKASTDAANAQKGDSAAVTAAANSTTKAATDSSTSIDDAIATMESAKLMGHLHPLENGHFGQRFAVVYSHSASNFSDLSGAVNALGLSLDITPEFALTFSRAFYNESLPGGGEDTKAKWIFGIEMNLNAFRTLPAFK